MLYLPVHSQDSMHNWNLSRYSDNILFQQVFPEYILCARYCAGPCPKARNTMICILLISMMDDGLSSVMGMKEGHLIQAWEGQKRFPGESAIVVSVEWQFKFAELNG